MLPPRLPYFGQPFVVDWDVECHDMVQASTATVVDDDDHEYAVAFHWVSMPRPDYSNVGKVELPLPNKAMESGSVAVDCEWSWQVSKLLSNKKNQQILALWIS